MKNFFGICRGIAALIVGIIIGLPLSFIWMTLTFLGILILQMAENVAFVKRWIHDRLQKFIDGSADVA